MKHKGLLAVIAACAVIVCAGRTANIDLLTSRAYADGTGYAKVRYRRQGSRRMHGYYSYSRRDIAASPTWINRVFTPMYDLQSPAGPFDRDFFFDSGLWPHLWNNSPYPN